VLPQICYPLWEVERGVAWDPRSTACGTADWDDALVDPLVERRHADANDLRCLSLAHRFAQVAAELLDNWLELMLYVSPAPGGPS
jgi:hypothetical protein